MTGNKIPHLKKNGLLAAYEFGSDLLGAPIPYFDKLGDTFSVHILGEPYVMTRDPDFITEVLVRQHASFRKDQVTRGVGRLLGNGLLTNDSSSWRPRRKAMQPHFQPAALENLIPLVQEETEKFVASWQDGSTIDIHQAMVHLAMRTALRALFGVEPAAPVHLSAHTQYGMDYFSGVFGTMIPLPLWLPTPTNRKFLRARSALRAAIAQIVELRLAGDPTGSPFDGLLEARRKNLLSHEELMDEALTMLLAGHDPSALTMTYTLAALAAHPLELAKVATESQVSSLPREIKDISQDSALKRALSESLRLYPASWAVGRECFQDATVLGMHLSKGTQITIHQWAAHRHPRWFPEPNKFLPDRWRGDFAATLPKGLYIPWGTGPRVCIGNHFSYLQMMISLRVILSRFRLSPIAEFPPPLTASITTQPRGPLLFRVTRVASRSARTQKIQ